jgi:hypothetical protein
MGAGFLFSLSDLGHMIALTVPHLRGLQDVSGAELNTNVALFAAFRYEVHASSWNDRLLEVYGRAPINIHYVLPLFEARCLSKDLFSNRSMPESIPGK